MEPIMPHAAKALPHGAEQPQSLASRMLAQRDKQHPLAHSKPGKASPSHEDLLNLEGMLTLPHMPVQHPPQNHGLPLSHPRVGAKSAVQQHSKDRALPTGTTAPATKLRQHPAAGNRVTKSGLSTGKGMAGEPLNTTLHDKVAGAVSGTHAGQLMHDQSGAGGPSRNTASVAKEKPVDHDSGAQAAMQLAHHPDRLVPVTDAAPAMPAMPRAPRPVVAAVETLPPDGSLTYTFKHWQGNRFVTVQDVRRPDDAVRWHFAASDAATGRHLAGQVPPAFATQWQVGEESGQSGSGQSYQEGHSRQSPSGQGDEEEA